MTLGRVLLTGPTSAIGQALVRRLARERCELVVLARDSEEVERVIADVHLRWSIRPEARQFDALDTASHRTLVEDVTSAARLDGAILCHGYMVDQAEA